MYFISVVIATGRLKESFSLIINPTLNARYSVLTINECIFITEIAVSSFFYLFIHFIEIILDSSLI
jgi:hypothetical protein